MILLKNISLAEILYSAKSEIDAMLLRLSNLSCVYLFVLWHSKKDSLTITSSSLCKNINFYKNLHLKFLSLQ